MNKERRINVKEFENAIDRAVDYKLITSKEYEGLLGLAYEHNQDLGEEK